MDIDIFGILIFLWFIFRGLRQGQDAKKEHEQNQRERRGKTKSSSPPVMEEQPIDMEKEEAPTVNPFPDWFPFPIPIEIEIEEPKPKRKKQSKVRTRPIIEKARQEEKRAEERRAKKEVKKPPILEEPATPAIPMNLIVQGEVQWKNESFGLELDRKALVNGIILSEILGPPKARRKIR